MPHTRLEHELAAMRALTEVLQQEQAALASAHAQACEALLVPKAALVAQLSALAASRHEALGTLGLQANESGMCDWLSRTPQAQAQVQAQALWDTLIAATREANALNRINGALLQQVSLQTQQALHGLRGQQTADIYGPGGQAQSAALRPTRAIG